MILDFERFARAERPYWDELSAMLDRLEADLGAAPDYQQARRLYYLYRRAASGLARLPGHAADRALREYLEALVARAYAHIHESRGALVLPRLWGWWWHTLPNTIRVHSAALALSVLITLVGASFGAAALVIDPSAKESLLPFPHLQIDPAKRVADEESAESDRLEQARARFAAGLATHNIRVSLFAMGLGMTYGFGTMVLLFYNGVILGAVVLDYVRAGQGMFLTGWLLPHGAIEIPAILLAGQAGLVLGHALVGWGSATRLRTRMRRVGPELVTMACGVMLLLSWAGLIESFFSQYHEPVIPYALKIAFGVVELLCLAAYIGLAGRGPLRSA